MKAQVPDARGDGHQPRRKMRVWVRRGSTPEQFKRQVEAVLECFGPKMTKDCETRRGYSDL